MWVLLFITTAFAGIQLELEPCATPFLQEFAPQVSVIRLPSSPPDEPGKSVRTTYPDLPNSHETENFVVWWGSSNGFDATHVQLLAESFEYAWEQQIDGLGYPAPDAAEHYKFNVYIGDTGGPSSLGANGYYYYDEDDWPMIVISPSLVDDAYGRITAAHEFFHAIQDSISTYSYAERAAWYFEASAVWMEAKTYPDSSDYTKFISSLAFLPELPLDHFDYPDSYDLAEYHHYASALFLKHLDEYHGSELIRRSWVEAPVEAVPVLVLNELLEEDGSSIQEVFFDYFDRNVTWDYPDQQAIEQSIEDSGGIAAPSSHRPSGNLRIPITTSSTTNSYPPQPYGGNYWRLHDVPETFYVRLNPGIANVQWHLSVTSERGGETYLESYTPNHVDQDFQFDGHHEADTVWLGIAATTSDSNVLPYSLQITAVTPTPSRLSPERKCGCSTFSAPFFWPAWFFILIRRRQSPTTDTFGAKQIAGL